MVSLCGCGFSVEVASRRRLRDVARLERAPCEDLCTVLFCFPCAVCQDYRNAYIFWRAGRLGAGTLASAPVASAPVVSAMVTGGVVAVSGGGGGVAAGMAGGAPPAPSQPVAIQNQSLSAAEEAALRMHKPSTGPQPFSPGQTRAAVSQSASSPGQGTFITQQEDSGYNYSERERLVTGPPGRNSAQLYKPNAAHFPQINTAPFTPPPAHEKSPLVPSGSGGALSLSPINSNANSNGGAGGGAGGFGAGGFGAGGSDPFLPRPSSGLFGGPSGRASTLPPIKR